MLARAIRIHERGGPEVMRLDEIDLPAPGRDEVQIRQTAIGLNFNETGRREGARKMVTSGAIRVHIGKEYRLEEVAQAHLDLVGRRTIGSSVPLP